MPDPIQALVAHYIATSYPTALQSFLIATGQPSPDLNNPPNPDLRTLAEQYESSRLADAIRVVKVDDKAQDGSWRNWTASDVASVPLAADIKLEKVVRSIDGVSAANLLATIVASVPERRFDTSTASYSCTSRLSILVSSVDKTVSIIDYTSGEVSSILQPHKAAVLSMAHHPTFPRYLLTGSMDGTTILTDLITLQAVQTFHSKKFVVRVTFSACGSWFATASYDKSVVIYGVKEEEQPEDADILDESDDPNLACEPSLRYEERYRIQVEHNPEALLFHDGWLIYTTRSSHMMHYFRLSDGETRTRSFNHHPLDTHISFSVLNMVVHPSGKVIACQTGDHAGSAGERILLYSIAPEETERLGCIWTGSDSDDYVLPRMAWLPNGTGLITTSPNGLIHLLSLTGEIRTSFRVHGGADGSSGIIRDCAIVEQGDKWEVVSVGYDRIVRISR